MCFIRAYSRRDKIEENLNLWHRVDGFLIYPIFLRLSQQVVNLQWKSCRVEFSFESKHLTISYNISNKKTYCLSYIWGKTPLRTCKNKHNYCYLKYDDDLVE